MLIQHFLDKVCLVGGFTAKALDCLPLDLQRFGDLRCIGLAKLVKSLKVLPPAIVAPIQLRNRRLFTTAVDQFQIGHIEGHQVLANLNVKAVRIIFSPRVALVRHAGTAPKPIGIHAVGDLTI